jgi:GxxExxY protein
MNTGISHGGTETRSKTEVKTRISLPTDPLTEKIIACSMEVHRRVGPGLLESIYESEMAIELEFAGIKFQKQVLIPIPYRGRLVGEHRLDLIVENKIVVELKSVERFDPVFEAQILTYLKLTNLKVGLLINFNSRRLKDGIRRFLL